MANKVVLSVISLVLVVGAVLGVVAVVVKNGDSKTTTPSNKAVETMCKPTEYKDQCNNVLNEVAKNSSATNIDYLNVAFRSTMDELKKGLDKAASIKKDLDEAKKDPKAKAAIESCEKMLGYATEELEQVLNFTTDSDEISVAEEVNEILEWLTAVRAYQTTCVDGIEDEELKKDMQDALDTATKLTFNAQKIVFNVHNILKDLGVDFGDIQLPSVGNRRLLEEIEEVKHEGFPSWVSAADRKLLGKGGRGKNKRPKGQNLFKTPPPAPLPPRPAPHAVVALDGSGRFKSINAALAAYPPNHQGRYVVYVKAGVYNEYVLVDRNMANVYMYGDGIGKTIITGDRNNKIAGIGTQDTATFIALGERFMARGITFRNTIGPAGHQAVAFRSQSPQTLMVECSFEGYQDTLYYHTHFQFYKNCEVHGTVDYIFGSGRAIFQDCTMIMRKGEGTQSNMLTADGRMKFEEAGGVVVQNCRVIAGPDLAPAKAISASYLGRPWKPAATSIIMQSDIGDHIRPEGWLRWESPEGANNHNTCLFREFANRGPGAATNARVNWPSYRVITNGREAAQFSAGIFLNGRDWLPQSGVPANLGL